MTRRKRYSTEFKREALRHCNEPGIMAVLVAGGLGISTRQLRHWQIAVEKHGDNFQARVMRETQRSYG